MPQMAAARRAAMQGGGGAPGRRMDLLFAGGVVVVAVAGLLGYPYAIADAPRGVRDLERAAGREAAVVRVPAISTVRESPVSAPPLVEPASASAPAASVSASPSAVGGQRITARTAPTPAAMPPVQDTAVVVERPSIASPPSAPAPPVAVEAPAPPVDPWQGLRDALAACSRRAGLWERATCEQGARLANCDGHWGSVALCPPGRIESGQ